MRERLIQHISRFGCRSPDGAGPWGGKAKENGAGSERRTIDVDRYYSVSFRELPWLFAW